MLSGIFVVFVRKYECEYLALFIRLTSGIRLFIAEVANNTFSTFISCPIRCSEFVAKIKTPYRNSFAAQSSESNIFQIRLLINSVLRRCFSLISNRGLTLIRAEPGTAPYPRPRIPLCGISASICGHRHWRRCRAGRG